MRHKLKQYEIAYKNGGIGVVNAYSIKDALKTEKRFFGDIEDIESIKRINKI
ncbi:hypothetical protein KQI86_19125 [Clostridium sp. MSJ-11]|uniref:Uncharacterized protein n=1 Tax=Clostridium mobile TaxID=2841512 RepID=A0ABS6EP40_9CLOT|nr:hypothetical protein [Clostridium mobile]MBU5486416.1 hypothetical protein [Clostridium mobile]